MITIPSDEYVMFSLVMLGRRVDWRLGHHKIRIFLPVISAHLSKRKRCALYGGSADYAA